MIKKARPILYLFFSIFLYFSELSAQNSTCFSYENLKDFYQKGLSSISETLMSDTWKMYSATEDSVVISQEKIPYTMVQWDHNLNYEESVILYYKDGYSNMVEFHVSATCFRSMYTSVNKVFKNKSTLYSDDQFEYKTFAEEDGFTIIFIEKRAGFSEYVIRVQNQIEIDRMLSIIQEKKRKAEEERKRKEKLMTITKHRSDSLTRLGQFESALRTIEYFLDTIPEFYTQLLPTVEALQTSILQKKIEMLVTEGDELYRERKWENAAKIYASVLELDAQHTHANNRLVDIRKKIAILEERDIQVYVYKHINKNSYLHFLHSFENTINESISISPNGDISINMRIEFDVEEYNNSSLFVQSIGKRQESDSLPRIFFTQQLEPLLRSPSLTPSYIEGIPVNSLTNSDYRLTWKTTHGFIKQKRKKEVVRPKNLFGEKENEVVEMYKNDDRMGTLGKYYFDVQQKTLNGNPFTDITMTKFKTVGAEAMLYSMIFPGIGTMAATQGKKGAWTMVSAIIFGGATGACFILADKKFGTPGADETIEQRKAREKNQRILQYVGYGTLTVTGVIYITDIFVALSKGIKNMKSSKELRKALKKEDIPFISEPIVVPTEN